MGLGGHSAILSLIFEQGLTEAWQDLAMKISPTRATRLASAVAIWVIAIAALSIAQHTANSATSGLRSVSVTGVGVVKVAPDSIRLDLSISSLASTAAASLAATAKSADLMRASLKNSGVDGKYLQAINLSTNPEYNYPANSPAKLTGYRTTQIFKVVIRDAKNSGIIIQNTQAVVGNALSINGTSSYVFDQKISEAGARTLAIADARAKAVSYAALTNSALGKVVTVEEQITQSNPIPMMAMAKSSDGMGSPLKIDLGQTDITVTVTTKWELK